MKNLYDFKKSYSLFSALIKVVVLVFIFTFVIFSIVFDLQLNHFSRALEKINPLNQVEEYRISNISFADSNYQNGFLEFSASNLKENDSIVLAEENYAEKNDAIIISNQTIYKIAAGELHIIGFIDNNFNGQNGKKLKIDFFNELPNSNFDDSELNDNQIPGWTAVNKELKFTEDKITGIKKPELRNNLNIYSNQLDDKASSSKNKSFKTELTAKNEGDSDYALRLSLDNIKAEKSSTAVYGPYVYSNRDFYLSRGDELIFDWKAEPGADSYSFNGYLLDQNNDQIQLIIDKTGKDAADNSGWKREKIKVTDPGRYIIVFAAGSYDFTGGREVGAELYIDNIKIEENNLIHPVTAEDLNNILEKVVYKRTGIYSSENSHLKIRAENNEGEQAVGKIVFNSQKNNIVFAREDKDIPTAEQAKSGPAAGAANLILQKYNDQDPERVDKLIIRNQAEDQPKADQTPASEGGQNFTALIYNDLNKNGIIEQGEPKVAEAAQVTLKAESIREDDQANYQLLINTNSKTGTALNIVLDQLKIDFSKIDQNKASQNYIIEIKK